MSEITLSAAVRDSLLSLQNTTVLINRTQGRLATGLSVASAIDDPIKFFEAKTLADRASDFDDKKAGIDQVLSPADTDACADAGMSACLETVSAVLAGIGDRPATGPGR